MRSMNGGNGTCSSRRTKVYERTLPLGSFASDSNRYGPTLTGLRLSSVSSAFFGSTDAQRCAGRMPTVRLSTKGAEVVARVRRTVRASGASTETALKFDFKGLRYAGFLIASMVKRTSSLVTGSPSDQASPSRSVTVYDAP